MSQHRKAICKNKQHENTVCYHPPVTEGWERLENALPSSEVLQPRNHFQDFCGFFLSKIGCIKLFYILIFSLNMYYELYLVIKYCFMTWFETAK